MSSLKILVPLLHCLFSDSLHHSLMVKFGTILCVGESLDEMVLGQILGFLGSPYYELFPEIFLLPVENFFKIALQHCHFSPCVPEIKMFRRYGEREPKSNVFPTCTWTGFVCWIVFLHFINSIKKIKSFFTLPQKGPQKEIPKQFHQQYMKCQY